MPYQFPWGSSLSVSCVRGVQIGLKKAESILAAASSLLSKLSGEKASWQQQENVLSQALPMLPASSVIAAAYVVYAAAVPENIRAELLRAWRCVDGLESKDMSSLPQFLSKGGELTEWRTWGLPTDQVLPSQQLINTWAWQASCSCQECDKAQASLACKYTADKLASLDAMLLHW